MRVVSFLTFLVLLSCYQVAGATFGKVVVIGGSAADLAVDAQRGQLYIANFAGRRIDVMSTANNTLGTPIPLTGQGESGSIALSPDNRFLLVANYADCTLAGGCAFVTGSTTPYLTIIDLNANVQTVLSIPQPSPAPTSPRVPLTVAFGKGSQALLVTTTAFYLVDPVAGTLQPLPAPAVPSVPNPLPVTFGTFPPQIVEASTAVSGDGETIFVLAQGAQPQAATLTTAATTGSQWLIRYNIPSATLSAVNIVSTPALGPRVVTANLDGSNVLASWALLNQQIVLLAQFPYGQGALNVGGAAWDYSRNLIYAQVPATASETPTLSILDSDNLNVRERIQLAENLGGRAVLSSDMNTLYAISDSGVTVFPIGSFATAHRVSTLEEQLLFQTTSCDSGLITQTLDLTDLGGGSTDFTLSVPAGTRGVAFSQASGTTPAQVTVSVDPKVFQGLTGTTVVPLTIQSNGSIGIPSSVRLLVNTKDPDQRGTIHSVPGTIVDLAADAARSRIYALRQDRNQVIVMDGATFSPIATLRTGNTPTKMTFTRDNNYLIVANDNSGIANVFDLTALAPTSPIAFPLGHYPRSIAASNGAMLAVVRNAGGASTGVCPTTSTTSTTTTTTTAIPGQIDLIDFNNRVASTPGSLGIFINCVPPDSAMTASPSGGSIFTVMSNGTVLLWDDTYGAFEASRNYPPSLGGSYAAVSDDVFLAGGMLFNRSMVETGPLTGANATSSVLISGTNAITVNADSAPAAGLVQRVTTLSTAARPVPSIEAPVTKAILTTTPVGQIGETILSFLETMAPTNSGSVLYLSVSGFSELPAGFDQPVPIPSISALGNLADGGAVAPGSLIAITGSGLAPTTATGGSLPLATTLGGICATVNSTPLPLIRVSPNEIDAQLPYGVTGTANLVVNTPGGQSAPFAFSAAATAPAVFQNGQAGGASNVALIVRAANNQLVDFTNPVHADDVLVIYATGLGQTSPAAVSGAAPTADPVENALVVPNVSLGATPLTVQFAGLVPNMAGYYQINVAVPHSIKSGEQVPLQIQQSTYLVRVVNP